MCKSCNKQSYSYNFVIGSIIDWKLKKSLRGWKFLVKWNLWCGGGCPVGSKVKMLEERDRLRAPQSIDWKFTFVKVGWGTWLLTWQGQHFQSRDFRDNILWNSQDPGIFILTYKWVGDYESSKSVGWVDRAHCLKSHQDLRRFLFFGGLGTWLVTN